jgi:transglutaminase-like putative cysteine protease
MMRYAIRHETRFAYDAAVHFARCNLRLRPIDWPGQHVESFMLAVEPGGDVSPARANGGLVNTDRLVIADATAALTIISSADIVVDRPVPIAMAGDPDIATVTHLARESTDVSAAGPALFLYPSPMVPLDAEIAEWCAVSLDPNWPVLEAGIDLACRIQREFTFDPHATMTGTPPKEAFHKRAGVCQDFAQIMIGGLRAAGLPAAYASGYLRTLPPPGEPRLVGADAMHAWVMLWCGPENEGGRGWIGLDPTNGILMAEDHIIVAIGRDYSDIAPVDGIFTGYGAQDVQVAVDVEPVVMGT